MFYVRLLKKKKKRAHTHSHSSVDRPNNYPRTLYLYSGPWMVPVKNLRYEVSRPEVDELVDLYYKKIKTLFFFTFTRYVG